MDELLAAIASNTEIILDAELYDLSTATTYGEFYSAYYYWKATSFDGHSLVICNVENLTIRSNDGDQLRDLRVLHGRHKDGKYTGYLHRSLCIP